MFLFPRRLFNSLRSNLPPSRSLRPIHSRPPLIMDHLKLKMSTLAPFAKKHKVTVVGSGNWGSTIAKVVAENTAEHPDLFERDVQMWVFEEEIQLDKKSKHYNESSELSKGPQKLTKLINEYHENVKYLPGVPLPHNVIANPSIQNAVKDSTILIFNLPHQFIVNLCKQLKGHILPYARGISCIKGVNVKESSISLFSETIGQELDIYCGALSGANIANEVAQEKFSETTIGYDAPAMDSQNPTPATSQGPSPESSQIDLTQIVHKDVQGKPTKAKLKPLPSDYQSIDHELLKKLFHRRYFHVRVISDVAGVSLGGALKNIVAIAAGWVDGLGWGDNAKAAVMRVGLLEMVDFGKRFFSKTAHTATFTEESCGVADLITTCAGGRNHRCAKMSIKEGKPIEEIEARELNGQKLQGTLTAVEVNTFLKSQGLEKDFPLFTAVYNILKGNAKAEDLPDLIESESGSSSNSTSNVSHETKPYIQSQPSILIPPPPIASSRYNRQLLIPQLSLRGQTILAKSKILILGLGGLGSPAALYLAGSGIHTLGLLDDDQVEESNLHRQIIHRESAVSKGLSKVASALSTLGELNSSINYVTHEARLTAQNAIDIVGQYDMVLDCTDNPATRYLASDACVITGKPLVSGAAQRLEGQLMVLNHPSKGANKGPCYRCVFPRPPAPETVRGCSEIGVLGPVVGAIGTLMASEAIRVLVHKQVQDRKPSMLLYNAWSADPKGMFRTIGLRGRRPECVACGDDEVLKDKGFERITAQALEQGRMDYIAFCGMVEDVKLLTDKNRIEASEFLANAVQKNSLVVDVREEIEVELGPKIKDSVNIPISKILRNGTTALDGMMNDIHENVYFVCQRGNDSQIAAQKLIDREAESGKPDKSRWIGDIKGGFLAMEKLAGGWN